MLTYRGLENSTICHLHLGNGQETPVWRARLAFPARKKSKIEEFLEKKGKENAFVGPLCVTLLNKKSSVEYCQQKNGNLSKLSP